MNEYYNEYHDQYRALPPAHLHYVNPYRYPNHFAKRRELVKKFAWAIPDPEIIQILVKYSPLVEMGAGTGYWAYLIAQAGGDILAFDEAPPDHVKNHWHPPCSVYFDVSLGTPPILRNYSDRTLLLIWPPYSERMARDCLEYWNGETLIYIGEGSGGCCACDKFFQRLEESFFEEESHVIPQWDTMHDYVTIYKRLNNNE